MTPGFVVTCVSVLLHVLITWLLVSVNIFGQGVYGGASALVCANFVNVILLLAYIRY
jgi:Na+-driven multidrug efflux pump